jgi:hypothetical protein
MPNMLIRNMDAPTHDAIVRAAKARGLRLAQYLAKLHALHNAIRAKADSGDAALQAELVSLGLETLTM